MRCCVKSGDHRHGAVNVCVRYHNMYNGLFRTDLHVPNMLGDFFHRGSFIKFIITGRGAPRRSLGMRSLQGSEVLWIPDCSRSRE